ncbi:hypothetical protein M3Y99_01734000 [Aphelenchoides fujianensis]|nr:hypothetical protein M3Y99_01734000 [Aphelenchoides fujianensis]
MAKKEEEDEKKEEMSELDISFSPSHFPSTKQTPDELINGWIAFQTECREELLKEFNLTPEMAARNSVQIEKTAAFEGRLLVISAHFDAPALIEQGREFVEEMQKKREIEQANYKEDHFSIISALYDPKAPITKRFVSFLQSS